MWTFNLRSVFVYVIVAALSERFSELNKLIVALPNFFSERVSSTNILRHCTSCTVEAKVLFKVWLWAKSCYQLRIRPLNVLLKI